MFKIELLLNTVMWNEGFEKADYPWLCLYTDNSQWVNTLPTFFHVPVKNEPFPQDLSVKITKINTIPTLPTPEQTEWETPDNDYYQNEINANQKRFQGNLTGTSSTDLNKILQQRINYWDGI